MFQRENFKWTVKNNLKSIDTVFSKYFKIKIYQIIYFYGLDVIIRYIFQNLFFKVRQYCNLKRLFTRFYLYFYVHIYG